MSSEQPSRVGVLEVGGARLKGAAWIAGPPPVVEWRYEVDIGDQIAAGRLDEVIALIRELGVELRTRSDLVVGYGCGQLRDRQWRDRLLPELEQFCDRASVLTSQEEGMLLLAAQQTGSAATHLLDVGGKSVQLVTRGQDATRGRDGAAIVQSWPCGTFAVQTRFGLIQRSGLDRYLDVAASLASEMAIESFPGATLLVGTSPLIAILMRRLAPHVGAGGHAGVRDDASWTDASRTDASRTDASRIDASWTVDDLDRAWRYCARLDSVEFPVLMPENPRFMNGADKAMLLAWVVAGKLGARAVGSTEASVMLGVACEVFRSIRTEDSQCENPQSSATIPTT